MHAIRLCSNTPFLSRVHTLIHTHTHTHTHTNTPTPLTLTQHNTHISHTHKHKNQTPHHTYLKHMQKHHKEHLYTHFISKPTSGKLLHVLMTLNGKFTPHHVREAIGAVTFF